MPTSGVIKWKPTTFLEKRKIRLVPNTTNGFLVEDAANDTLRYFSFGSTFNDLQGDSYHAFDICVKGASTTGKPSNILTHPAFSTVVDPLIPGSGTGRPSTTGAVVLSLSTELGKGTLSTYTIFFDLGGGTQRAVKLTANAGVSPSLNSLGTMTTGLVFDVATGAPVSVNITDSGIFAPVATNLFVLYADNIFGAGGFSGGLGFSDYVTANGTIAAGKLLLSKIISIDIVKKYERKIWETAFSFAGNEFSYSSNPTYKKNTTAAGGGAGGNIKYCNVAPIIGGSTPYVIPSYAGLYDEHDNLCAVVTLPKYTVGGVKTVSYIVSLPRYD